MDSSTAYDTIRLRVEGPAGKALVWHRDEVEPCRVACEVPAGAQGVGYAAPGALDQRHQQRMLRDAPSRDWAGRTAEQISPLSLPVLG